MFGLVSRVFCLFIGLQLPRPRGVFHSILVFMSALPKEGIVVFSSNLIGQSTNLPIGWPMESYTDMSRAVTVVIRGEGTER